MTPRGAERPDDDADLRDEQAGRSRRRFGRGRPDSADRGSVPEEETGWLDDLRTAKQERAAIGPDTVEPEPGHGRRSIDPGPYGGSGSAPPARPSSGVPAPPSSEVADRPSSGVPGRGRHTSDEFPTISRHGSGEHALPGRRHAPEETTAGRHGSGEHALPGRRDAPGEATSGDSGEHPIPGRRRAPDDTTAGRHGSGEHATTGRRRAPDETPTGRHGLGESTGRHGLVSGDVSPASSSRPVSPVPGGGGTGFGSRNVNPGRPRPDTTAAGRARPDGTGHGDGGRHGAPEPGPRAAAPGGSGRVPTSAATGTGAIPPIVPGPAGVRSPAGPGRAGATADGPSGVLRRPDGRDGHPGGASGSVRPEHVRPRVPRDDVERHGTGPVTGPVTGRVAARVGVPPTGRVTAAASVAGIVAPPPGAAVRPGDIDAPVSPGVAAPPPARTESPVRPEAPPRRDPPAGSGEPAPAVLPRPGGTGTPHPGDGPARPATGTARVTAAASVPGIVAVAPVGIDVDRGPAGDRDPGVARPADAPGGERPGLRERMRTRRQLRVASLVTLAGVVLLALPLVFGVLSVVRDPVFRSLDALEVPGWAAQDVDDRGSGSRWCFMDCRFRERTAQSQRPFAQTNQAYAAALRGAGWQPWKVAGCPDQPIAPTDGVYTCWRRDEFTLDLWVRLPECAVDQVAAQDPALAPSNPPGGAPKPAGKCAGSTVSIKVQAAITDNRGTPAGEQPGLTGETPDPVLSNDPLLVPTPSPS